ncbi:hypothetical protein HNQ38_000962 [Desulfovibrio intestinalis]|uniref:Uncharacterized protein n=1 Tax=Desulfovibrio intestinalis TaxID=58621 RepID=A0A7W8BZM3_9BACT|nr:hypothetical protein [Desulfovibrio intestinalis]
MCSNAAQECSVDSAEKSNFWQNGNFEMHFKVNLL